MANDELTNIFDKTAFSYTLAQGIKDGFLIDITAAANKAGFKIPIAVTQAVWNKYIAWVNDNEQEQTKHELDNRLQNMLTALQIAIRKVQNAACIHYELVVPRNGKSKTEKKVQLKAILGADDNGEAVIIIMLSDEN